jgi:hypothetical protein
MTQVFLVNPTPLTYKRRGRGGLDPTNHNTLTQIGYRVFYPHGSLNLYKPLCPLRAIVFQIHEHPYAQI